MEQIKRVNKLFSNECIFLRNTLSIPVKSEKRSLFNGLSLESPDSEGSTLQESLCMSQDMGAPSPPPEPAAPEPNTRPVQQKSCQLKTTYTGWTYRSTVQTSRARTTERGWWEVNCLWPAWSWISLILINLLTSLITINRTSVPKSCLAVYFLKQHPN